MSIKKLHLFDTNNKKTYCGIVQKENSNFFICNDTLLDAKSINVIDCKNCKKVYHAQIRRILCLHS
jgi:hypothetical protein